MESLKNPLVEKLAAKIAANWDKRNEIYTSFILKNPDLKRWEAAAIAGRARFLHQEFILVNK